MVGCTLGLLVENSGDSVSRLEEDVAVRGEKQRESQTGKFLVSHTFFGNLFELLECPEGKVLRPGWPCPRKGRRRTGPRIHPEPRRVPGSLRTGTLRPDCDSVCVGGEKRHWVESERRDRLPYSRFLGDRIHFRLHVRLPQKNFQLKST